MDFLPYHDRRVGELGQLVVFPTAALAWLAGQGIVHFVIGRYCNYKSNQLMGVNLAAPIVQLQVPFAMMLAVVTLHEKFTVLQVFGSVLMLGGSVITQSKAGKGKKAPGPVSAATPILPSLRGRSRVCWNRGPNRLSGLASHAATPVVPKFISSADQTSRWTGANGGLAFFAYCTNYLVDLKCNEAGRYRPDGSTPDGGVAQPGDRQDAADECATRQSGVCRATARLPARHAVSVGAVNTRLANSLGQPRRDQEPPYKGVGYRK